MHAVSHFAAMIALKRGLDPEIATMIGLLHDLHTLMTGDSTEHAAHGSALAKLLLTDLKIVSREECKTICKAIQHHSKKSKLHDPYSELAKDADVLSHYFFNTTLPVFAKDKARLQALMEEFALSPVAVAC
jgi:uncharacterized protein